jgi:hypothetical protein
MMMYQIKRAGLLIFGIFFLQCYVQGQTKTPLSIDITGASFNNFVSKVESLTGCRFYFDEKETDSLVISVKLENVSLDGLLKHVLNGTGFQYSIDRYNRVFVSRNRQIQTLLPPDFFAQKKSSNDSVSDVEALLQAPDAATERLKASLTKKLFEIGDKTNRLAKGNSILTGYIRDAKNGEALSGALLYTDTPNIKTIADQFGYFSITLPRGRHTLKISSVGMKDTERQIQLYGNGKLNIEMEDFVASLKAVTVNSKGLSNVRSTEMGVERISVRTIKQVPTVLGEADILRVVLTLPGVTSVGEASTGFNVRGGAADQNLILLNDATIYNPSHLFGFFSAFSADVVKGIELYKTTVPEKYGGRLSSVLDISTKDGNSKKLSVSGGIGVLTSRLAVEGPLDKEGKTTFILGGRTTYSDWVLKQLPNKDYANSSASFYDLNLNLTHTINARNNLYLTAYVSNDRFKLNSDTLYKYGNKNLILKWKHHFNDRFYSVLSLGVDQYDYSMSSDQVAVNAFKLAFSINQKHFRTEFNYNPDNKHAFTFGLQSIYYKTHPGSFETNLPQSLVAPTTVPAEQAVESALYIGDKYRITPDLSVNAGIRYSMYNYMGPHDVYNYAPGLPRQESSITDTSHYGSGSIIKTYHSPEFRLAATYIVSADASLKFSFNTLQQYLHVISNTTAISPTDIYKLSDTHIKPQKGYQVSLGYYRNFFANTVETSVEVYYKGLRQYLDYKSGASLILNKHLETDIISSEGYAYGAEFMIKKNAGKLNGWLSYTYSRTLLRSADPAAGETINNGSYYPANYDKPHNINLIGNYKVSHRVSISLNSVYSTGRPITYPIAVFTQAGGQRVLYSDRNQYRIPDYFRTDFSINIEGNHKVKKLAHSSFSLGVYNVLFRQNPYSVYFIQENGAIKGYQLSIFGTAIPFITYNFKF